MDKTTYSVSTDGEQFNGNYDSREDAIADARHDFEIDGKRPPTHTARNIVLDALQFIRASDIIGALQSQADEADCGGEASENWLFGMSETDEEELVSLIAWWVNRKYPPTWYGIDEIEEVVNG